MLQQFFTGIFIDLKRIVRYQVVIENFTTEALRSQSDRNKEKNPVIFKRVVYFFFVTPVLKQLILLPKASNAVILHNTHKVSVGIDVLTH